MDVQVRAALVRNDEFRLKSAKPPIPSSTVLELRKAAAGPPSTSTRPIPSEPLVGWLMVPLTVPYSCPTVVKLRSALGAVWPAMVTHGVPKVAELGFAWLYDPAGAT